MSEQQEGKANLVWLDMEMTGLDPERDTIIEVATLVTDNELNVLEEGPNLVIHQSEEALSVMDDWNVKHHGESGLLDAVRQSSLTVELAEQITLDFLKKYCQKGQSPLCGNSIEQDRRFIHKYMPELDAFLHYRHVNVSSFKEMVLRWYDGHSEAKFEKKKLHKALDDIQESLAEMRHYRKHFFVS